MAGKDTFIISPGVVKALDHWGAFKGEPKGKAARADVRAILTTPGRIRRSGCRRISA
jgi:hypothetical protein